MGLHQQNHQGIVLRGAEARKHLEMHKRDSHGTAILMNYIPSDYATSSHAPEATHPAKDAVAQKKDSSNGVATVDTIVYVTVPATFTGSTAGYVTMSPSSSPSTQNTKAATSADATTASPSATSAASDGAQVTSAATSSTDAASTSSVVNNKSMFLNPPASALSSASSTYTAAAQAGSPLATSRDGAISPDAQGMSGGAKAGLTFGIIIALALAGGLLYFCWRRRKNTKTHEEFDEKRASSIFGGRSIPETPAQRISAMSEQSHRSATTAPRLSLRPVTQFLPNLTEQRKSAGNLLDVSAAMSEKPKSLWDRKPSNAENPFSDNAAAAEKQAPRPETPPENPFDEPEGRQGAKSPSSFKSAQSGSHSQKLSWEGSEPPTPKSAKFGTAAAVTINAGTPSAAPPVPAGPNNVHRVQLDFKPSMDDELELKSGQLVRLVHEYDDGWALCRRMDGSQQGVAPRTCLSKMPVKPRQGPPPPGIGANGRPNSPMGPPRGPMVPRPLTPNSREGPHGMERPASPAGMPVRKPVPGQAM